MNERKSELNGWVHGFRLEETVELPEIDGVGRRFTHERSGARLLHLDVRDDEHLFVAAFRTPPPDDTGLPHILEHTVLCGSRRYPVKDPFVEMLKSSLATFLNAITWPDRTIYPCASANLRDFRNLMAVYCDAVFHPLLTEDHFRQEGHHLAVADPDRPDSPLVIRGVVFNEMKGAYSTLDGMLDRIATAALLPDTPAGRDSGGWPEAIPSLTYEQFVQFHRNYYHPSNAYLILYTSSPLEPHLKFLDEEVLASFSRRSPPPPIPLQPRWTAPRQVEATYPALPGETPERRSVVTIDWLTHPSDDVETSVAMSVAFHYLLAHAGCPLRRALEDTHWGDEVLCEHSSARRETTFTVGLLGTDAARAREIEALVFDVLRRETSRGFDRELLDAAFHQFELGALHIPELFPLTLADRVLLMWLYEASPWTWLEIRSRLAVLRERMREEPRYIERAVERWLIANPHRVAVVLRPDPELNRRREEEWRRRLEERRRSMSPAELERLARETRELDARTAAPNPPEALATLPRLSLADVSPEPRRLPTTVQTVGGRPMLRVETFTRGVAYVALAADVSELSAEDWVRLTPLVPLWFRTGAAGLDHAAMARRESAVCGGLAGSFTATAHVGTPDRLRLYLMIATYALDERLRSALDLLTDRLWSPNLLDPPRVQTLLGELQSGLRDDVLHSGTKYAASRAGRHFGPIAACVEALSGLEVVRASRRFAEAADRDGEAVGAEFEAVRRRVLSVARWHVAAAGSDAAIDTIAGWFREFVGRCPQPAAVSPPSWRAVPPVELEGIAAPADVAFTALAVPAVPWVDPRSAALRVLCHRLTLDHLWTEIRVRRGAYGCGAMYAPVSGVVVLSSYRDPTPAQSLEIFRRIPDHVEREMDLSPGAVEQAVIGTLKPFERPYRPAHAVGEALARYLRGEDEEFRRRERAALLRVDAAAIREVAATVLRPSLARSAACVIANRDQLRAMPVPEERIEDL
ncbi:MAG: insulinase family protein [Kiritimatiellae bacterium]|nr:insulinase family protein [Kiritimatiellia bacterium]